MEKINTTYTVFLSKKNLELMEKDQDVKIITFKECLYVADPYYIVEFQLVGDAIEENDPEIILNSLGGLALHEDGSNYFFILENDLNELSNCFCWEGSGDVLMSELLTAPDKKLLLYKKQKEQNLDGDILLNVGSSDSQIWRPIQNAEEEIFTDKSYQYRFNGMTGKTVDIWWPFLIKEQGGFSFIIQKDDEEDEDEEDTYPIVPVRQPDPFNTDDDDYFWDPEDYGYNRHHWGF